MKHTFRKSYQNKIVQVFMLNAIVMGFFSANSMAAGLTEADIMNRLGGPLKLEKIDVEPYRKAVDEMNACMDAMSESEEDEERSVASASTTGMVPDVEIIDPEDLLDAIRWQERRPPSPETLIRWEKEKKADLDRRQSIDTKLDALEARGFNMTLLGDILKQYSERSINSMQAACKLQGFFIERDQLAHAVDFYKIAVSHELETENRWAATFLAHMYLREFNARVRAAQGGDVSATSHLFYLINDMLPVLGIAGYCGDDVLAWMESDMIKLHSSLVRRYLSTDALAKDSYYGTGALASRVWAHDFGQKLVAKVEPFRVLLRATRYKNSDKLATPDKSATPDLAKLLGSVGFKILNQSPYQDIWVHPEGFTVRVKHGERQFTIGYNFLSPVEWKGGAPVLLTTAQALAKAPRGVAGTGFEADASSKARIADFQYNEAFKIALTRDGIFIIPAFRDRDCIHYWGATRAQLDELMTKAHHPLPEA